MTTSALTLVHQDLANAFDAFNASLFENKLPSCLITLQRRKGAYGFFAADRFANPGSPNTTIDEIAMNPALFTGRNPTAILATLAEEMVNVWQHHFGKPGRTEGYCNRQGAQQRKRIGLIPSDTGEPGGKETGMRISCYIERGGAFEHACKAFLATREVVLYPDRPKERAKVSTTSRKTQYACPNCRVNAWSKPGVSLRCGDCDRAMQVVVKKRAPALLDGSTDFRD